MVLWRPIRTSRTNTKKDILFSIGDWNEKVGSQEIPGVTGKFGLGVQNEAGEGYFEFCQEYTVVIAKTLFQQNKRRLYTWTLPDGQYWNQTDYIPCSQRWRRRQWHPTPVLLPENHMDGGAWKAAVHGVAEGWTRLSDFTLTFYFRALEKEMATHSSVLAWRSPGTGEPGRLPSMGSHRVGHNWSDLAAVAAAAKGGEPLYSQEK